MLRRRRRCTPVVLLVVLPGLYILSIMVYIHTNKHSKEVMKIINRKPELPTNVSVVSPSLEIPLVLIMCQPVDPQGNEQTNQAATQNNITLEEKVKSWSRQAQQLTTMLTTLLYFSKAAVWRIIVMTDTLDTFNKVLGVTVTLPQDRLLLQHRAIWLPHDQPFIKEQWRPCAWAKQFLAEALPHTDSVVYVDTDVIFLGPAEELWWLLGSMGSQQAVALAPEPQYLLDNPRRPYAGTAGLNTGVMVANLTRLRQLPGGGLGTAILDSMTNIITPLPPRHDQDALNYYLTHTAPHLLLQVTARWNFLPSSCFPEAPPCQDCLSAGIIVLHGAEATFFRAIDRKFLLMHAAMTNLQLHDDPRRVLAGLAWHMARLDSWSNDYICSNYTNLNQGLTFALTKKAIAVHN